MDYEARFRAIFDVAYPALIRYALYRGLSRADADDLVGATLEVAWRKIDQVPTDDPLPWLYAVERNLLMNLRRSNIRRSTLLERLPVPEAHPAPGDESTNQDHQLLRAALAALDDDDQEILRLVAWDELTPSQAAVVLGISAVASRTRLHRARRRLATRLESYEQRRADVGQIPSARDTTPQSVEVTDA
jgi:RNA polymerase sigma factor (sigma-70 family)